MEAVIFKKILLLVLQIDCAMSKGEEPWVSIPLKAHLSTLLVARSHGCTVWHTPSIKTPDHPPTNRSRLARRSYFLKFLSSGSAKGTHHHRTNQRVSQHERNSPQQPPNKKNTASRTIKG